MAHECQIWYLVMRLYIWRNKDIFGSPLKTFALKIVELMEKPEEINKNIRTYGCGTSRFRLMALWRGVTHLYSLRDKYFVKKLLYHIVAMIALKPSRVVTHCCAASFPITSPFCKTNNIFYSLENRIWDKTK